MADKNLYELELGFEVKIAKWRIDDQSIPENREWALFVFDKIQNKWIDTSDLDRTGEQVYLTRLREL